MSIENVLQDPKISCSVFLKKRRGLVGAGHYDYIVLFS